ncbi:SGNH/GDSL hydrolase family protein [Mucilaginibacter sp. SMC90]|uniref:SGNH/GDSL hydrolase family protein n=1 Tax=Mucilaginibacter sp. SMC90 TaxID=2929803 RepID=UPI001FB33949|nr:SGNH/GDSL hydrolase family protein [Mucilaginibacter sp. SMC90]UOE47967.1 SGNH/GDSL hydrolase family protein [Mucilaginibacter sp. SMC90]
MIRPLTDHRYRINGGEWVACSLSNTIDNGDHTYTIKEGLEIDIPIGGLEVQVKPIGLNPESASLVNAVAFTASSPITPVISFIQPDDMVLASIDQPLMVSSSHNSPSVNLVSSDPTKATVFKTDDQWYLHVVAAGSVSITASQNAESGYNSAAPVVHDVLIAASGVGLMPTNIYTDRGIPDTVMSASVSQLTSDLQAAGLWDDLVVLYPGVGKTDLDYLLNLKNPVDSDGAYRAVPATTPISVTGDGLVTTVDSLYNASLLPMYSKCLFVYKRNLGGAWIMGCYGGSNSLAVNGADGSLLVQGNNGGVTPGGGLQILNIVSSTKYNYWRGGVKRTEDTPGSSALSLNIAFNGLGSSGGVGFNSQLGVATAGIFNRGLTDSEATTLNTIIENYNSSMFRSITTPPAKVHFYGDSITAGSGASVSSKGWAYRLCALMNWEGDNAGEGGSTITTANPGSSSSPSFLNEYTSRILQKTGNDKFIFISFGTNDTLGSFGTPQDYKDGITQVVNYALTKGWSVDDFIIGIGYLIGIEDSTMLARHESIMAAGVEVCNELGITKYHNLHDEMVANGAPNTLHPNDDVHVIIAIKWKKYLASVGVLSSWA